MRNILGLIPARGGSKSIPRKNIIPLAGRPLLAYTCEAALGSRLLTRVVLSTDDQEIAEVGRQCGVQVPFQRPAELAQDETPSVEVANHAVRWLWDHQRWEAEIVVLLQPTSPLRQSAHIDAAVQRLWETGADTVVSVIEVPHRLSPYAIMEIQHGRLQDFWKEPTPFDRLARQNLPRLYARNGPAILACRTPVIKELGSFYGKQIVPYVMREEDSIDIDTFFDLRIAESTPNIWKGKTGAANAWRSLV